MATYKIDVKGLSKLNQASKSASSLNDNVKKTNKNLKKTEQISDKLTSTTTGKINEISDKFKKFSGDNSLSRPLQAFSKQFEVARGKGEGLFSSAKKGFGGMKSAIGRMGGLSKVFGTLFKSVLRVAGPIALIMGAFMLLKKMFQLNVGGMATGFFKIVGEIKAAIGQLTVWINKSLRKLGPLFKTYIKKKRINQSVLGEIVKNKTKEAGLNKKVTAKVLRHTFATHLMDNGVDISIISSLMGHRTPRETGVYLHAFKNRKKNAVNKLSKEDE